MVSSEPLCLNAQARPFSPDVVQDREPDLPVEQALHYKLAVHALVLARDGTIRSFLPDSPVAFVLRQEARSLGLQEERKSKFGKRISRSIELRT